MTYFKQYNLFVCPLFEWLEMKKNVSLLPQKTTTSFFTFFVFVRKKQVCLLFGFKQRKKQQQLSSFVSSFFFYFPSDDNWWQVGRWSGITNLVMTWWLGWVVTKLSKWSWHHILKWFLRYTSNINFSWIFLFYLGKINFARFYRNHLNQTLRNLDIQFQRRQPWFLIFQHCITFNYHNFFVFDWNSNSSKLSILRQLLDPPATPSDRNFCLPVKVCFSLTDHPPPIFFFDNELAKKNIFFV